MPGPTQPAAFRPVARGAPALLAIGDPVAAANFPETVLRWRNDRAAAEIGLAALRDDDWLAHFGRFAALPGAQAQPLALRYHGHQFGTYNPDLGDGRGFLLAQCRDATGRLMDLATKGSGTTPWSRSGDGRLTLKGAVRELLATEMLAALGVETSRTFSIIETGEALHRGDEPSPTRSAVLVRLSHGHIRIGSFQRLAYVEGDATLEALLRYTLTSYAGVDADMTAAMPVHDAAVALVAHTATRCARLAASYMAAGFVHGVLNSDNINVTGESFDYGPWRFTPRWEPGFVAAYFDEAGRYAFGRQAEAIYWNVGQLALSLSRIAETSALITALESFGPAYENAMAERFCWRLGVTQAGPDDDRALVIAGERLMRKENCLIDSFFTDWAGGAVPAGADSAERTALIGALTGRTATRGASPPVESMHIEEVEAIWAAIAERDDWQPLMAKVARVRVMGDAMADAPRGSH